MISSSKIAKLANLSVSFDPKLEEVLEYINVLKELNTEKITPTYQVGNNKNTFREDEIEEDRIIPAKEYKSKITWTN